MRGGRRQGQGGEGPALLLLAAVRHGVTAPAAGFAARRAALSPVSSAGLPCTALLHSPRSLLSCSPARCCLGTASAGAFRASCCDTAVAFARVPFRVRAAGTGGLRPSALPRCCGTLRIVMGQAGAARAHGL